MKPVRTAARLLAAFAACAAGGAAAQPVISKGSLLTATLDVTKPPGSPRLVLDITGEPASNLQLQWQGPSGEMTYQTYGSVFNSNGPLEGHVVLQGYNAGQFQFNGATAFTLYTEPGTWTLANVQICNGLGQCNYYDAQSLAAILKRSTFTIINPNPPDIEPPAASSATIQTPVVSIANAPDLGVALKASDNLSGVYSITVIAELNGSPFNQLYMSTYTPTAPMLKGKFEATGAVNSQTMTGVYAITQVVLQDIAGNSGSISDPATIAKLFHNETTITVNP